MANQTDLFRFIKRELRRNDYTTIAAFARDTNLHVKQFTKYIRGEQKFDLHYFMALVEALNLDALELYKYVYQNEKKNGLI